MVLKRVVCLKHSQIPELYVAMRKQDRHVISSTELNVCAALHMVDITQFADCYLYSQMQVALCVHIEPIHITNFA